MVINTTRFGEIEVDEQKIIYFKKGIPGVEYLKKYIFLTPENSYPIYYLQSIEDMNIVLPVMNPYDVISDYTLQVSEDVVKDLGIENDEDLLILNVAVIPKDIQKMTINLAAPILINIKKLTGVQYIMDTKKYSIRESIYDSFVKLLQGGMTNAGAIAQEG